MPDFGKLLKSGAKSLGKSMLSGIADGAISMILTAIGIGDDDGAQLNEIQSEVHSISLRVDELVRDVKAVQSSIDRLGVQMSHVLLELKLDDIEALGSKMGTTYGQIAYVLKSLTKHLMVE
jgi:outer membrane murein-binding lipoprotein Lpp